MVNTMFKGKIQAFFLWYRPLVFNRKLSHLFPCELVSEVVSEETTPSSQCWWLNCLWVPSSTSIIKSGPTLHLQRWHSMVKDGVSFGRGYGDWKRAGWEELVTERVLGWKPMVSDQCKQQDRGAQIKTKLDKTNWEEKPLWYKKSGCEGKDSSRQRWMKLKEDPLAKMKELSVFKCCWEQQGKCWRLRGGERELVA